MNRLQLACCLSFGFHTVALVGGEMFLFHGPKVAVSQGQTRVDVVFRSASQEKEPPEVPAEAAIIAEMKPQERLSQDTAEAASIPSLEDGVEEAPPAYRRNLPPPYPREAFLKDIQGTVWILAQIDRQGHPLQVQVEHSSGSHLLDAAAVEAVAGWQFIPARRAGIPIVSRVRIPMRFQIVIGRSTSRIDQERVVERKER